VAPVPRARRDPAEPARGRDRHRRRLPRGSRRRRARPGRPATSILDIDERSAARRTVEPGVITAEPTRRRRRPRPLLPARPGQLGEVQPRGQRRDQRRRPTRLQVRRHRRLRARPRRRQRQRPRRCALGHRSLKGVTGYDLVRSAGRRRGHPGRDRPPPPCAWSPSPAAAVTLLASLPRRGRRLPPRCSRCQTARASAPAALELADRTCAYACPDRVAGELAVPVPPEASGSAVVDRAGRRRCGPRPRACERAARVLPRRRRARRRPSPATRPPASASGRCAGRSATALRARWPRKVSEDVAVPLGRSYPRWPPPPGRSARSNRLDVASFGHAGDGNLHVNVLYDPTA
jgi:hypothetical protein